jgi:hypothetical protein
MSLHAVTSPQQQPTSQPAAPAQRDPRQHVMQIGTAYILSACLGAVAKLHLANHLTGGPKPVAELARATETNDDALYRVLRVLASVGIFRETAPRTFALTPAAQQLVHTGDGSFCDLIEWATDGFHFKVHSEFMHSLRTGGTAVEKATGMSCFDYFKSDPVEGAVFNRAMTAMSAMAIQPVLETYDFSQFGTLVDVAGGHGYVLAAILKKHPKLLGVLFEMAHVVEGGVARMELDGLKDRCQFVTGDFFESVPAGGDAYLMKHIIHDWPDADAITILKNCRLAAKPTSKCLLLEFVLSDDNEPGFGKFLDIEMMVMPGGRERTEREFAELFRQSGWKLNRIVPTKAPICVVEAVAV